MGPLTFVLYGLLVAFGVGDAVAHFTHYRYGETVSASIWQAMKRFPELHWIVLAFSIVLTTHLELQIP